MCQNCYVLTIRLECILWAIAEIVLCVGFIVLLFFLERGIDIYSFILLGALSLGIMAGFCLLLGAILKTRFLVLAWNLLICPVVLVVVVLYYLMNKQGFSYDLVRKTIGMMLVICWTVYMLYLSRLLIIEIKTGERQKRYPHCYPRGVIRERRRTNSQSN